MTTPPEFVTTGGAVALQPVANVTLSPSELRSELNDTARRRRCHDPKCRVGNVRIGEGKLRPVQSVECFQSQLERQALSEVRGLEHRCVQIVYPLTAQKVSWRISVYS